jgi:hypothetical protein
MSEIGSVAASIGVWMRWCYRRHGRENAADPQAAVEPARLARCETGRHGNRPERTRISSSRLAFPVLVVPTDEERIIAVPRVRHGIGPCLRRPNRRSERAIQAASDNSLQMARGFLQPSRSLISGSQPNVSRASVISGQRWRGSSTGSGLRTIFRARAGHLDHQFGQFADRELVRVARD